MTCSALALTTIHLILKYIFLNIAYGRVMIFPLLPYVIHLLIYVLGFPKPHLSGTVQPECCIRLSICHKLYIFLSKLCYTSSTVNIQINFQQV